MADISFAIRAKSLPPGVATAALAAQQHGVVTLRQLTNLGLTPTGVQRQIAAGRLHPVHAGVYAVGHRLISERGRMLAATLAMGPHSAVSHRAGAGLHGFNDLPHGARIDVIVPRGRGAGRRGIALHHTRRLPKEEVTRIDGIPVTSVARTLVDLAAVLGGERLRRCYEEADRLRLLDRHDLAIVLDGSRGRRGVRRLRALLGAAEAPAPRTHSNPEIRLYRLWQDTGLPMPEVNSIVEGFEVDFCWPDRRLIVELDGPAFHRHPAQQERDRRKDVVLSFAGYAVHRFGTNRIYSEPNVVLAEIQKLHDVRWQRFPPLSG